MTAPDVIRNSDTCVVDPADIEEQQAEFHGVEPLQLRRIVIRCAEFHVDLAVPAHEPIVSMLGDIAEHFLLRVRTTALERGISPIEVLCGAGPHGRWQLSRPLESPFAPTDTLAEHNVTNGELLVLTAPALPQPTPIWDDPLAAIAATNTVHRWSPRDSQRFAANAIALIDLAAIALSLHLLWNISGVLATAVALSSACIAAGYTHIVRTIGASAITAAAGTVSTVLFLAIAVAGIVPGPLALPHLLAASSTATAASFLAACFWPLPAQTQRSELVNERSAAWVMSAFAACTALCTAVSEWTAVSIAQCAALTAIVGIMVVLAAPSLSVAWGSVQLPSISDSPSTPVEPVDMERVHEQSRRARQVLVHTHVVGGTLSAAGVSTVTFLAPENVWSWCFAVGVILFLLFRPRAIADRLSSFCLLTAALLCTVAVLAFGARNSDSLLVNVVIAGAFVAFAALTALGGWWLPRAQFSPFVRRCVDIASMLVLVALPPLALFSLGAVQAVRG